MFCSLYTSSFATTESSPDALLFLSSLQLVLPHPLKVWEVLSRCIKICQILAFFLVIHQDNWCFKCLARISQFSDYAFLPSEFLKQRVFYLCFKSLIKIHCAIPLEIFSKDSRVSLSNAFLVFLITSAVFLASRKLLLQGKSSSC